jgi:hypothetical protein
LEIVKKAELKPSVKERIEENEQEKQIEKLLTSVFSQWDSLSERAKTHHLETANVHANLPIAQLILETKGSEKDTES